MEGIKTIDLNVKVHEFALMNINLDILKGTIMGLVGRNGAGKTTLIKSIAHGYKHQKGNIFIDGKQIYDDEISYRSKLGVVYDDLSVNRNFTPKRLLKKLKSAFNSFDDIFYLNYLDRFNVSLNKKLKNQSLGAQKKFSIILTMSLKPSVLILDEPTANIDPADKAGILDLLQDFMQDENHTILYSTHITNDLEKIADYICLIDQGEIKFIEEKDKLVDTHHLLSIPKKCMNDTLREQLIGINERSSVYQALTKDISLTHNINYQSVRSSIEDIIIYYLNSYKERD